MKSKIEDTIGLQSGKVRLLPYNPKWVRIFKQEERILRDAIGNIALDIQHVGSTAIPGMPAKPIIDIAVGVLSLKDVKKCIKPFEKLGYKYKGKERVDEYLFTKDTIYCLHMIKFDSDIWKNYLLFRDHLCTYKKVANDYKNLKLKLAKKFPNDRALYTSGKRKFIGAVIEKAKF